MSGSIAKIGTPKDVIQEFMKGCDDTEKFEVAELGEKVVVARDLVKRYISMDRAWSRQSRRLLRCPHQGDLRSHRKSGAGKTTLSGIIAGLIEPTSGEINVRIGEEWIDMTKPGIEQRGRATGYIGLLHQEYTFSPTARSSITSPMPSASSSPRNCHAQGTCHP